jgi:hypothetical protein
LVALVTIGEEELSKKKTIGEEDQKMFRNTERRSTEASLLCFY